MSDEKVIGAANKFAQEYVKTAQLPLTAADLAQAFFAGKNYGMSRPWHRIEESSPSHKYVGEQIALMFQVARDTYDIKVVTAEDYDVCIGRRDSAAVPMFWAYLRTLFHNRVKFPRRRKVEE